MRITIKRGPELVDHYMLWVLVKPQIDNYFDEVNSEIAIKTCGGKEKVKNTTSEGFECK